MKYNLKKYDTIDLIKKIFFTLYVAPLGLSSKYKEKLWRNTVKRSIKKYIKPFSGDNSKPADKKYIFVCWLQGIENAPYIVQKCVESIKENSGEFEVIVIDEKNYSDWVDIPNFIIERWQSGKMLNALFSDILRLYLLCEYGGIWIDSTVYMFGSMPEYIFNSERFMYQASFLDNDGVDISSWFIYTKKKEDPVLVGIRDSLVSYLEKKSKPADYFIFHDFVSAIATSEEYSKYWKEMPYACNVDPHLLQRVGNNSCNKLFLSYIKNTSPMQKLTYKLDYENLKTGTYYDNLFNVDKLRRIK